MILLLAIYIFICILIFINRRKDYFIINILIISVMSLPGIMINGNLINFIDILIPIMFIYNILLKRVYRDKLVDVFMLYLLMVFLSVIFLFIESKSIDIGILLKFIRLVYIIMVYILIKSFKINEDFDIDKVLQSILIGGIISAGLGIIFFINQETIYNPSQTMYFGGKVLFRAGGIFKEASSFGAFMNFNIVLSLLFICNKKIHLNKILCYINLILSLVGLLLSYTRISTISLVISVIIVCMHKWKYIILNSIKISIGLVAIVSLLTSNSYFKYFYEARIEPLFTIQESDMNKISSGRLGIWSENINNFFDSGHRIIFGSGYKSSISENNEIIDNLGDNNFISSLTQTGIMGLLSFILLNYTIFKIVFRRTSCKEEEYNYIFLELSKYLWIVIFIHMFTCDAFTYYRNMSFMFIIIGLDKIMYKKYITSLST